MLAAVYSYWDYKITPGEQCMALDSFFQLDCYQYFLTIRLMFLYKICIVFNINYTFVKKD